MACYTPNRKTELKTIIRRLRYQNVQNCAGLFQFQKKGRTIMLFEIDTFYIEYESDTKKTTKHCIVVDAFDDHVIEGNIFARNHRKVFYINQIKSCSILLTDEVVTSIAKYLTEKLTAHVPRNAYETVAKLISLERDFILILGYLGRLSCQLRQKRRNIIVEAVIRLTGD